MHQFQLYQPERLSARLWLRHVFFFALCCFFPLSPLRAVIFFSTADPNYNTSAPTGTLINSGWEWVGNWGGFQGTPIGPHHFLTARHVGGTVGESLNFKGVDYATVAFFDDALSDLRIWEISGTFSTWAPLYREGDEVGRPLVVFGRGLTRGAEVRDVATSTLRGWLWGAGDGRLRWGRNVVSSVVDGGSYWGALLYAKFDAAGGSDEAHLAIGDSSGPIFINDGASWKLAGIAAAVDASFNTTNSGAGFNAAIFDARGLYYGSSGNWGQPITGPTPVPSGFYATRISIRTTWIDGIVPPTPVDASDVPLLSVAETGGFAAGLFLVGIFFIKRSRPPVKSFE